MPDLTPDEIATQIGTEQVVSLCGYVSEALGEENRLGLVSDSWFASYLLFDKDAAVARLAGAGRQDGKSVVWLRPDSAVTEVQRGRNGASDTRTDRKAFEVALDELAANTPPPVAQPDGSVWSSPPPKNPR